MIEQSPDGSFGGESGTWSSYEMSAAETASESIVYAVADVTDRDPLELRPLYDVVDPDAIDRLFDRADACERPAGTKLRFAYEGHEICLDERRVFLRKIERGSSQVSR